MNHVLAYMVENNIRPTVQNYINLAYWDKTREELEELPEDWAEIEELIKSGRLVNE